MQLIPRSASEAGLGRAGLGREEAASRGCWLPWGAWARLRSRAVPAAAALDGYLAALCNPCLGLAASDPVAKLQICLSSRLQHPRCHPLPEQLNQAGERTHPQPARSCFSPFYLPAAPQNSPGKAPKGCPAMSPLHPRNRSLGKAFGPCQGLDAAGIAEDPRESRK